MNERLSSALDKITDKKWGMLKAFTDDETSRNPQYITVSEAKLLKLLSKVVPAKFMPFVVQQWGGPDGREKFEEALNAK